MPTTTIDNHQKSDHNSGTTGGSGSGMDEILWSSPTNNNGVVDHPPRSVARSIIHWYRSQMNPYRCNEDNVQEILRPAVVRVTTQMLLSTASASNSKGKDDDDNVQFASRVSRRHQARMEALLAGCALTVPNKTNNFKKANSSANNPTAKQHPQIPVTDLHVRLELYLRSLDRFVTLHQNTNVKEECVLGSEPPKDLRARARATTNAFVATATYVGNVAAVLTRLLVCLTMEVLAVEHVVEEELVNKILKRHVVSNYMHGTSFASLAFLSTPEVNADSLLTPLIVKYLQHLQKDWKRWVRECEIERLITSNSSLSVSTRSLFKEIEFQSIGHLLEVCHEYQSELSSIEFSHKADECLATIVNGNTSLSQLQRHVVTINGLSLPPITGNAADLVETLTNAILNASMVPRTTRGTIKLAGRKKNGEASTRSRNKKKTVERLPLQSRSIGNVIYDDDSSLTMTSSLESDNDEYLYSDAEFQLPITATMSAMANQKKVGITKVDAAIMAQTLSSKLIECARHTGKDGAAYYFVKDLFGGEQVRVIPTTASVSHLLELRERRQNGTLAVELVEPLTAGRATINTYDCFDIYPQDIVPEAGYCEPLVQFHTSTQEKISLTATLGIGKAEENAPKGSLLSIRPSLYQKY